MNTVDSNTETRSNHQEVAEQIRDRKLKPRWLAQYRCPKDRRLVGGLIVMQDGQQAIYAVGGEIQHKHTAVERGEQILERLDQWIETGTPPPGNWPARKETTIDKVRRTVEPAPAELQELRRSAAAQLAEAKTGNFTEPPGLRFIRWETDTRQIRPGTVDLPCPRCHHLVRLIVESDGNVLEHA